MTSDIQQPPVLSEDHREALQEIVNIGMGAAGDSLARALGIFVKLSIPRIQLVHVTQLAQKVGEMVGSSENVTAVQQAFFSHWLGETITIFQREGNHELGKLLHYPQDLDADAEAELLLDVANILCGACMNGIAENLNVELNFSPPSILQENTPAAEIFNPLNMQWEYALLLEVNFKLENHNFTAHLLTLMSQDSIEILCTDVDRFLESY